MPTKPPPAPFHVTTSRGRESREASLAEAVDAAAHLERRDAGACATCQPEGEPRCWYVYGSQAELDRDLERGPITSASPNWFAVIRDRGAVGV